jgi:hypothetical protein
MMTLLCHLMDASFECGPGDESVVAFMEAASIIGGHDAMEEFLVCGIWPLSEKCEFEVDKKEAPLSKVVVPIPKFTPIIGRQVSEAAFEA